MNEIVKVFENRPVRIVEENGVTYFVGRDVCGLLGYKNPNKAMNDHCRGITKRYPLSTEGGIQELRVLSEPDVTRLICGSKLPAAVRFEKWVFEEVLPSIRKTGAYVAPNLNLDAIKVLVGQLTEQVKKLLVSNAELRETNAYLLQFRPKSYLGDISKANGMPKCEIRAGSWVSKKGRKAKRLDPAVSGFLQLDLWYDYVPMALLAETVNIITANCPKLLEASNA